MVGIFKYRILLADDDEALLATTAAALAREGYVVETARDGFEALTALHGGLPEILISDLKMPNMSGFELLAVVRRRFPAVGVIAYSGEFSPLTTPEGVLADRFLTKGVNAEFELLEMVRELLSELPLRTQQVKAEIAPAWLPLSATGYVVVTCPSCLRSFSVTTSHAQLGVIIQEACIHCGAEVRYRLDTTTVLTGGRTPGEQAQTRLDLSRRAIVTTARAISESKRRIPPRRK